MSGPMQIGGTSARVAPRLLAQAVPAPTALAQGVNMVLNGGKALAFVGGAIEGALALAVAGIVLNSFAPPAGESAHFESLKFQGFGGFFKGVRQDLQGKGADTQALDQAERLFNGLREQGRGAEAGKVFDSVVTALGPNVLGENGGEVVRHAGQAMLAKEQAAQRSATTPLTPPSVKLAPSSLPGLQVGPAPEITRPLKPATPLKPAKPEPSLSSSPAKSQVRVEGGAQRPAKAGNREVEALLKQQAAANRPANEAMLSSMVGATSPADLKREIQGIDKLLTTAGNGNIYKNDATVSAAAKKTAAFDQFNFNGALLTRQDLGFIRQGLKEAVAKAGSSSASPASMPGALSAEDRQMLQSVRSVVAQVEAGKAELMRPESLPPGVTASQVQQGIAKAPQLRKEIDAALQKGVVASGSRLESLLDETRSSPAFKPDNVFGIRQVPGPQRPASSSGQTSTNNPGNNPPQGSGGAGGSGGTGGSGGSAGTGGPGGGGPEGPKLPSKVQVILGLLGVGSAALAGIHSVDSTKQNLRSPLDLKFERFKVGDTLIAAKKNTYLGDPVQMAQQKSKIVDFYMGQVEAKLAVESKSRGTVLDGAATHDMTARLFSMVRAGVSNNVDTSLTPVMTAEGVLQQIGAMKDARAASIMTQGLALANQDIGMMNSAETAHWSGVEMRASSETPAKQFAAALAKGGMTSKEFNDVPTKTNGVDFPRYVAKVRVVIDAMDQRIRELDKQLASIKGSYEKVKIGEANWAGSQREVERLGNGLTGQSAIGVSGTSLNQSIDQGAGLNRMSTGVASLMHTIEAERSSLETAILSQQSSLKTLIVNYDQTSNTGKSSVAAGEQATIAKLTAERVEPVRIKLAAKQQELLNAQQSVPVAAAGSAATKDALNELNRKIGKYERAPLDARQVVQAGALTLAPGVQVTLRGGVETDAGGRQVVSAADQATLIGEAQRYRALAAQGVVSRVAADQVASAVGKYMDVNTKERQPLVEYPNLGLQRNSARDPDALNPQQYQKAVYERAAKERLLAQQPGAAAQNAGNIGRLQAEVKQLYGELLAAQKMVGDAIRPNPLPGSQGAPVPRFAR